MNTQRIYFPVQRNYVIVGQLSNGRYVAMLEDLAKGWTPGYGPTLLSALADLTERNIGLED